MNIVRSDLLRLLAGKDIEAGSLICGAGQGEGLAIVLRTRQPDGHDAIHLLRVDDPANPYVQFIDRHRFSVSRYGHMGRPKYSLVFDMWPENRAPRATSVEVGEDGARLLVRTGEDLAAVSIENFSINAPDDPAWSVRTAHWQLRARFDDQIAWNQSIVLISAMPAA